MSRLRQTQQQQAGSQIPDKEPANNLSQTSKKKVRKSGHKSGHK